LIGSKEKQVSAPVAPTRRSPEKEPKACAASSMTLMPWLFDYRFPVPD
jgi:hypothetical protein